MQKEVIEVLRKICDKYDNITFTVDENPSEEKKARIRKRIEEIKNR